MYYSYNYYMLYSILYYQVGTAELSEVGYSLENFSKFLETTSSYIQLR